MRFEIRAVTHDGLCAVWKNICFIDQPTSKLLTLYTCYGGTIQLNIKNYRYIKIVAKEEVKDE